MNFLEDKQFQEILQLAVDKKIEDLAVPMIQSKLDKEIRILIDKSFTGDKVKNINNMINSYLYKRINQEIKDEQLTDRLDLEFIEQEIITNVSEQVFKNLRIQLLKK